MSPRPVLPVHIITFASFGRMKEHHSCQVFSLTWRPSILCLKHWYFSAEDSWQCNLTCWIVSFILRFHDLFSSTIIMLILVKTGCCPLLGLSLKHSLFNHLFTQSSILFKDLVISLSEWPDYCNNYGCLSSRINAWLHFCDWVNWIKVQEKKSEKKQNQKRSNIHTGCEKMMGKCTCEYLVWKLIHKHLVDNYYENCHCQLINKFATTLIYWKKSKNQW